ncbi:MAG: PolC-type DNA polymerase III [Lachnospiraceae bacterium]|nr:PolC-type DNA polymerase III [Lachnospiraceae bacterium]
MLIERAIRGLVLPADLRNKTAELDVKKIIANRSENTITIHAVSDELIPYGVLRMLSDEVHQQSFKDIVKRVDICVRFYCIEENDDEGEALRLLLELIQEENTMMFRQMDNAVIRSASFFAEGGEVKMTLPGDSFFATAEDGFRSVFTDRMKFWSDRFTKLSIVYSEPDDLSETYPAERVYNTDEYIAKLVRSRAAAEAGTGERHKPKDIIAKPKKEPTVEESPKPAFQKRRKYPDDPDLIFGKPFDHSIITPISAITDPYQSVVVQGQIFSVETRELVRRDDGNDADRRPTKTIITFNITDFDDSIAVRMYVPTQDVPDLIEKLKEGAFVCVAGDTEDDRYTKELGIGKIEGVRKAVDTRIKRSDNAPEKRVELHCHTQMSDMDAVVDTATIVKRAFEWGHPAIAITDHGVVQSFVDAAHAIDPKKFGDDAEKKERYKKFKVIYGMEGYIVDDEGVTKPDGTPYDLELDKEAIRKLPSYHIILLCKNDVGRNNLYRLVSRSHIDYYYQRGAVGKPRIPKSLLRQMREGLIIGSACEAGELFRAILFNKPEEEIKRISDFYDYYEIQPLGNNQYMIESEDIPQVTCWNDLAELNKRIVDLADAHGKMCIATCDVHFLNPEDEIYRRIIMAGKGFKDADSQPPLYFRTTAEMLEEFSYLPEKKAYEIVVTNPNRVNNMIEKINPVRPDKCPPVIENSDTELREICYNTAHSWYGEELPKIVSDRLEKELHSIISNGYAVMYIIAQRLVKHSNDDGYLVGSRGSVGSSFVATMSGITEVNPLPAHYFCKHCHYSDFDSEEVRAYALKSGFDLPAKDCPNCGRPLTRDGQNIPFETFLGFYGDKEPDIDLNFSSEYQSKAHAYTEVLFGKGHTFRAGTVGTLADKTAYGFIKKYYEDHGIEKRTAEIDRLVQGCVGVRRTTGQHPGGIIVLPHGEEIDTFTPVQHPANDMTTDTITTHFDYHKIDQNLLKLDILGHEDPTMIRMLEDLSGIDVKTIPMDDPKVVSLMSSTEALGITPDQIDGCETGSLGLPELGTNFVIKMLLETKPQSFSDMIRISGLSHGTDVWTNNTQDLIRDGKCVLSTAICTRDDIMTYLIAMGLPNKDAFGIMEKVRKGKGLTPEAEELMKQHEVPDWYIWSCKQIKYMFPKAHACAYVMMAFRVAYFKLYMPLMYYTAYFTIRANNFNYDLMARGQEKLEKIMREYKRRSTVKNKDLALSEKQQGELKDMRLVQEMYARGFDFAPIDIYKAKATKFQIIDGKIMPSLTSISGLGTVAAQSIEEHADANDPFLSREDFRTRCGVGKSVTDLLLDVGLLTELQESNQMRLEDVFGANMFGE